VIIQTKRFGEVNITEGERIEIPQGILGFPEYREFCLVDPGDDTLILWLQSLKEPSLALPVLEPKIFSPEYSFKLTSNELRELKIESMNDAAVFSVLTIPEDITGMTANLKAPLVLNRKQQIAKQIVLQESKYPIKHPMFKELRRHLVTIEAHKRNAENYAGAVSVRDLSPSNVCEPIL